MTEAIWGLVGVVIGGALTGAAGWLMQSRQFAHDRAMFALQNKSAEMVKALLSEMLNHRGYVDRSFEALKRPIGGYSDDQVRQFLHEIGARRTSRDEGAEEWWYLVSRQDERIARRKAKESGTFPLFEREGREDDSSTMRGPHETPDATS